MHVVPRVAPFLTAAVLAAGGVTALASPAGAATQACTYGASQLAVPSGATSGAVTATAGTGVYAGEVGFPVSGNTQKHALIWSGGSVTDLGTVPGAEYTLGVNDVNSAGTAVGFGWELTGSSDGWPLGENHPFRSRAGKLEQLPVPSGAYSVEASVIAENGDIYGDGYLDDPNYRTVFYWPADKPGTVTEPTGFPQGSRVEGIDTDGTVAVTAVSEPKGTTRPYLWKGGVAKALPVPTGAANSSISSISNGIVVGEGQTSSFTPFAVLWGKDGKATRLPGGYRTTAVNDDGLILGTSATTKRAALWQLTAAAGAAPSGGSIYTLADDATLGGSKPAVGTSSPSLPTVWRCG